jgi:type VI secretion system protein ImpA
LADAVPAEVATQLAHVRAARDTARKIDATLTGHLKQENTVDIADLVKLLDAFERELSGPAAQARAPGEAGAARPNGAAAAQAAAASAPGVIASRQDVIAALDRCCEYFRQHEPSSPVPLLLQRAKRLVTMDFIGIVRDLLATQGVTQVEAVVGKQSDSGKGSDKSGEAEKKN